MLKEIKIEDLLIKYDYAVEFFEKYNININEYNSFNIKTLAQKLDDDFYEEFGTDKESLVEEFIEFIELMESFNSDEKEEVKEITILPGFNKLGEKENYDKLEVKQGEIIAIVGPTGSGKSRLLADIEWAANEDTPTKRKILINGNTINPEERFNVGNRLVAQLSQNMNFVMDLTVQEFLDLHATSRLISNKEEIIDKIFNKAINLAGEKFTKETPITNLSGGQSRALMIADTAFLSKSPIILIDEIENAGIDRREALELLVSNDKIVLMSTHDPILALMSDKRIVISNGGIAKVTDTTKEEKSMLEQLEKLDKILLGIRTDLRYGKQIKIDKNILGGM